MRKIFKWFKSLFKKKVQQKDTYNEITKPIAKKEKVDLSLGDKPAGTVQVTLLVKPINQLRSFRYRCVCGKDHFFKKSFHPRSKTIRDFKLIGDCGKETLIPGSQFIIQN